jgi:hypothetical protein
MAEPLIYWHIYWLLQIAAENAGGAAAGRNMGAE